MRILFVDDDLSRLVEARNLLQNSRLGVAAAFVSDQFEAESELDRRDWDVLVAAVDTPRSIGARIMASAEHEHPTVARLVHSQVTAARDHLGAHMFLKRPFSAQQLRQALHGTVRWRDRLGRAAISQLVAGARDLPTLPAMYRAVQQELNSDDPSMHRVGQIIQSDAATSIRVLRVANSALFGLRSEVGDVVQATALLGMRAISSLALAASLFAHSDLDQRFLERMWQESMKVGAMARHIAEDLELARTEIEEAQLAGLLHDIGDFVLFQNWPKDFLAVDRADRDRSELELFGATHADIGGYLTAVWELPMGVVDAVTNHHTPSTSRYPQHPSVATAVHVARTLIDTDGRLEGAPIDMTHIKAIGRTSCLQRWGEMVTVGR